MFSENLKILRSNSNLSQKELAKRIDLSSNIICEYEKGRSQPNIDTLIKLSKIFNCTVDYLIGNENDFGIVATSTPTLTKEESELLATFKLLTLEDQYKAIGFVKALAY